MSVPNRWFEICFKSGKIVFFKSKYEKLKTQSWWNEVLWIEQVSVSDYKKHFEVSTS